MHRRNTLFTLLMLSLLTLTACSDDKKSGKAKKKRAHLVTTSMASIQSLTSSTTRTGTVELLKQVKIFNQEEGRITQLKYYPDDNFNKGDVLIRIDGSLLEAQLDKAIATRKQAELDLKRSSSLVKKRLAAAEEKARIATALRVANAEEQLLRTRLAYTKITAPFAGTVSERLIEPGDIAPRHTHLLTIIDKASLLTRVNVSELILPLLKQGSPATISIDALGKQIYKGRVQRIYPTINPNTRLGTVEVSFDNIPENARAGSLCRVTLTTPEHDYLVIPFTALRRDDDGEYVFVIDKNNKASKIYVQTGLRHQNLITVIAGLSDKQSVVTRGFLGLKQGQQVTTK